MAKFDTVVSFSLVDGISRGIRSIVDSLGSVGKAAVLANQSLELAGKGIAALKVGADVFTGPVNSAASFEAALRRVVAITGDAGGAFDALKIAAEQASLDTGRSVEETAGALENLARNGLSATDAIAALPSALALAKAGALDAQTATSILGDSLDQFGLAGRDAARIADLLAAASVRGGTGVGQLAEAFQTVAPAARQVNASAETTAAALGVLAQQGIEAGRAGKVLSKVFVDLANPTSDLREHLRALGDDSGDFAKALETLGKGGSEADAVFESLGAKVGPSFRLLVNQGIGAVEAFEQALQGSTGAAQDLADKIGDGFTESFNKFQQSLNALGRGLGEPLLAPLTAALEDVRLALNEFAGSPEFDKIKDFLGETFEGGAKKVREFLKDFDFERAREQVSDFVDRSRANLNEFIGVLESVGNAVGIVYQSIRLAFGAIDATISGAIAAIATAEASLLAPLAAISDGAAKVRDDLLQLSDDGFARMDRASASAADALNRLGERLRDTGVAAGEAQPKIAAAEVATAQLSETALKAADPLGIIPDYLQQAGAAAEAAGKGFNIVTDAVTDAAVGVDKVGESATAAGAKLTQLQLDLAEAVRQFSELQRSGTASASEIETARANVERLSIALSRLQDEQRGVVNISADLEAALGKLGVSAGVQVSNQVRILGESLDKVAQAQRAGTLTTEDLRRAFEAYAAKAIEAARSVDKATRQQIESQVRAKAAALGLADVLATMGAMGAEATAKIATGAEGAAQALETTAEAADNAATSAKKLDDGARAAAGGLQAASAAGQQFALVGGSVSQTFLDLSFAANQLAGTGGFNQALDRITQQYKDQQAALNQQLDTVAQQNLQFDEMERRVSSLRQEYNLLGEDQVRALAEAQRTLEENQRRAAEEVKRKREELAREQQQAEQAAQEAQQARAVTQGATGGASGRGATAGESADVAGLRAAVGQLVEVQRQASARPPVVNLTVHGVIADDKRKFAQGIARELETELRKLASLRS